MFIVSSASISVIAFLTYHDLYTGIVDVIT